MAASVAAILTGLIRFCDWSTWRLSIGT